jgi:hypothetical protein
MDNLVTAAHAANPPVPVSITVDPHTPFQAIADNTDSTTAASDFVTAIIKFCGDHHLDGIDMDYEPGTLTSTQMNSYGQLLSMLHAQTSAHGLMLSAAVQVSQHIIPQKYLPSLDRYYVMDYDLDYYNSAPLGDSETYLDSWATYGVPKSELWMGMPFYGTGGTSWADASQKTYSSIFDDYHTVNGTYPAAGVNDEVEGGTDWGYTGIVTAQQKATYAIENGYAGTMIWDLGQDHFDGNTQYDQYSLFPGLKAAMTGVIPMAFTGSNTITLKRDSDGRHIDWSTGPTTNPNAWAGVFAIADLDGLTINGGAGNTTIALDYSAGNPLPNVMHLNGTFTINGLQVGNPLANTKLDIGQSTVYLNYGTGASPATTIQGYLKNGYNGGLWNGGATSTTGAITSSAAQAGAANVFGVGYVDSADNLITGQPVHTIELRYTVLGDSNLDRVVNMADALRLQANYNATGTPSWDRGNFNYDTAVNGSDAVILGRNYTLTAGGSAAVSAAATALSDSGSSSTVVLAPVVTATDSNTTKDAKHSKPKAKHHK